MHKAKELKYLKELRNELTTENFSTSYTVKVMDKDIYIKSIYFTDRRSASPLPASDKRVQKALKILLSDVAEMRSDVHIEMHHVMANAVVPCKYGIYLNSDRVSSDGNSIPYTDLLLFWSVS